MSRSVLTLRRRYGDRNDERTDMLIYLIGSLLLGALQAMRSAADAGCVLNYLRNAGPAWIADLRLVAARSRRALARTIAAAAFATLAQKANAVSNEQCFKQCACCKMVIAERKDRRDENLVDTGRRSKPCNQPPSSWRAMIFNKAS